MVLSHLVAGERVLDNSIAAAVEGPAGFVVAGDSDLLDVKEYNGIRMVNPRAFLDLLGGDRR